MIEMNKWLIGNLTLVFLAFALTSAISLSYSKPIGADIHFHIEIAKVWAQGRNGMFSEIAMKVNKMPYPPLFHLLLVPSVWLNAEYLFARILQVLLLPLTLTFSMLLTKEQYGEQTSFFTGFLLLSSLAFTDRLLQAIPQSLDFMLYPIIVSAYLKNNKLLFFVSSLALIYNHGLASIAFIAGLCLFAFFKNRKQEILGITVFSSPIILYSIVSIPIILQQGGTPAPAQETAFWQNPLLFTFWYLGILTTGLPLAIWLTTKWKKLSKLEQTSILTLGSLLIMLPFWSDRFLSYTTIPLAILLSNKIANMKTQTKLLVMPILAGAFMLAYTVPWLWLLTNTIDVK